MDFDLPDLDFDFPSFSGGRGRGGGWIFVAIIVIAVIAIIAVNVYMGPKWDTEELTKQYAHELCHGDADPDAYVTDYFDNELLVVVEEIEEPYATRCTVQSAGRDGIPYTEDDINAINHDYHKTKIISEWAGGKAKEALRSFWKGYDKSE